MIGGKAVFYRTVVAVFVEQPAGRAERQQFLKFPGGDVPIPWAEKVHYGAPAVVDAGQLRGGVIAVSALLVRNAIRIRGSVFIELTLVQSCGRIGPVQLTEQNDLHAHGLDLSNRVAQLLPGA